jgi:glucosylglycerate phosphorylase
MVSSNNLRTSPLQGVRIGYDPKPDFTRPALTIPESIREQLLARLTRIYGVSGAKAFLPELERLSKVHHACKPPAMIEQQESFRPVERFTERDVFLITYGDLISGKESSPLATLERFCDAHLKEIFNTIHILPFFPYSSDRGFSITDFETVDPKLGSWDDIERLAQGYQLMFDGVINHMSAQSRWFQEFLNGHPYYRHFFIGYPSPDALTPEQKRAIFRPRTSDILTPFHAIDGPVYVWTTFSEDQVDLNYHNSCVLLRMIDVLLDYVRRGAEVIRLDAITYLWSEPGTSCIHLPQTHEIVKLIRDIFNLLAPTVALITETNVPHEENISYFGNGRDEADMVYNFALPPLVLHTFYKEDAGVLSDWADTLNPPSEATHFFNFLDSHDGIGLLGAKTILSGDEIDFMVERVKAHGGLISYKTGSDGRPEPYEMNITWFSAINRADAGEPLMLQVKRFIASRAVALVLKGVPAIYLHSVFGTCNDTEAVAATGSNRAINRGAIDGRAVDQALEDPSSKIARIKRSLEQLVGIRRTLRAFHPRADQRILPLSSDLFALQRIAPEGDQMIVSVINVTGRLCQVNVPLEQLGSGQTEWSELVQERTIKVHGGSLQLTLQPYDVMWLQPRGDATP